MTIEPYEFHGFLLNNHGSLSHTATKIPEIREYLNDLPDTQTKFNTGILPVDVSGMEMWRPLEFLKVWPFDDAYGVRGKNKAFVNPTSPTAHRYSDIVVQCVCGELFARNHEDMEWGNIHKEADILNPEKHGDCAVHQRYALKSEMIRQRESMALRVPWLGWQSPDLAKRFGASERAVRDMLERYGIDIRDRYDMYRTAMGNTAAYLIRYDDVSVSQLADIYGHAKNTIRRYIVEYGEWGKRHESIRELHGADDVPYPPSIVEGGSKATATFDERTATGD